MIVEDPVKWLHNVLPGGHVKRFHTVKTVGTQTVAEHSFGVAMLVTAMEQGKPSCKLLKAALFHDIAELVTGDTPAPTKWQHPNLKAGLDVAERIFNEEFCLHHDLDGLYDWEQLVLKWADMLEFLYYVLDQLRYGNGHAAVMFNNGVKFLESMEQHLVGQQILNHLITQREAL